VRAHLCKRAEDWLWSSYRAMIGKEPTPAFLSSDWLLTEFGVGIEQARVNFAAFIRAAERGSRPEPRSVRFGRL